MVPWFIRRVTALPPHAKLREMQQSMHGLRTQKDAWRAPGALTLLLGGPAAHNCTTHNDWTPTLLFLPKPNNWPPIPGGICVQRTHSAGTAHILQGEMKAAHCSACSRAFLPQRFAETRNGSAPEHDGSKCGHPRPMLQHPWFHRIEGWSAATGGGSRTSPSDTEPSCLWPPDMGWPYRPRKKWVDLEFVCRWTFNCSESISVWCWVCRL